jgi:hypothetical protein
MHLAPIASYALGGTSKDEWLRFAAACRDGEAVSMD